MSNRPEDDDEVATCTECHSDQNIQKLLRNPFFHQGGAIPCHYCGGIVKIVRKDKRDAALKQADRERGI